MNILILTQKVDNKDDVLGFFHGWIEEFSKKFNKVSVICLEMGEHDLPANTQIFSLGKEKGISKLRYIINFYKLIFFLRKEYDAVFVHMNQEYMLLGGLIWRLMGKKTAMWRNHAYGNFLTRVAVSFSKKVFCTSPHSFTAKFKKTKIMPVGIDTGMFTRDASIVKQKNSLLSLGRISPVKKVAEIVGAGILLTQKQVNYVLNIYGFAKSPEDKNYLNVIQNLAQHNPNIKFLPGTTHTEAREVFNKHEIFVNLTPDGSYDKTMFEAMACETLLLTSNSALKEHIPAELFCESTKAETVAAKISHIFETTPEQKEKWGKEMRNYVHSTHSLEKLVEEVRVSFS